VIQVIKVMEVINVTYFYDTEDERNTHVKQMKSEGWECSGQIKETPIGHNESYWCGKYSKRTI
jgi:hypothetical protein